MNETKEDTFTEIVEGIETPCQFSGRRETCPDDPARWVMFQTPCCEASAGRIGVLACDTCMAIRTQNLVSLRCEHCDTLFEPASTAYFLIEPLEKK